MCCLRHGPWLQSCQLAICFFQESPATGLIGTWSLTGTSETIQVILGAPAPPAAAVPGPLPLFGAGVAFGWSRRLRKRIAAPLITPPQA
jgi:hypothetical protein